MRAKEEQKQREELEAILKLLEKTFPLSLYNKCKWNLEEIYDNIAEGIHIRSRCQWCEEGEQNPLNFS